MPINVTVFWAVIVGAALFGAASQAAEAPRPSSEGLRHGMYSTHDLALKLVVEAENRVQALPASAVFQEPGAGLRDNVTLQLYRRFEQRRYFNR